MAAEHSSGFLHDTNFWVLLSFSVFALLLWLKGRGPILTMLDARTKRIKDELEEAERLKLEAQAFLADIKKQHRDAVENAEKIIRDAEAVAQDMAKQAEQQLSRDMKRREEQVMSRITLAQQKAIDEVRSEAAHLAAAATKDLLTGLMDQHDGQLIDSAVADLSKVKKQAA